MNIAAEEFDIYRFFQVFPLLINGPYAISFFSPSFLTADQSFEVFPPIHPLPLRTGSRGSGQNLEMINSRFERTLTEMANQTTMMMSTTRRVEHFKGHYERFSEYLH